VVTHLTTNPPVSCLNRAERTGSLVLKILWSYVKNLVVFELYIVSCVHFGVAVCGNAGGTSWEIPLQQQLQGLDSKTKIIDTKKPRGGRTKVLRGYRAVL
jgi:hypothetical protein